MVTDAEARRRDTKNRDKLELARIREELHKLTPDILMAKTAYRKNPTPMNAHMLKAVQIDYDSHIREMRRLEDKIKRGGLI